MKAPFLFWSEETGLTCPTPGVPYMPLRCTPAHSSAPGTTAHDRQQGRPGQMQDRPHTRHDTHTRTLNTLHRSALDTRQAAPGRSHRRQRWMAGSVSETVQICTHSNMNEFQHKNVCKTIDTNTRMCYYIDNTRTCYATTKQEDKNHEKDHRLYRTR